MARTSDKDNRGFFNGIVASVSYGTNPLFALPMYAAGMAANSVLFYRYFLAVAIYGLWLKLWRKMSFKLTRAEFLCLAAMGVLFALSSVTLFVSFNYLDSGIACTLLFVYPAIVAAISALFFRERLTPLAIIAMAITLAGIVVLNGGISGHLNPYGVAMALLSGATYAVYIVMVKNLAPIKNMRYEKLSFYVMLFGLAVFVFNLKFCTMLQPIESVLTLLCGIGLALFPTIISLEQINKAIRRIGPTSTAVLGALEPLTAIAIGAALFGERLRAHSVAGIALILTGVMLIILKDKIVRKK